MIRVSCNREEVLSYAVFVAIVSTFMMTSSIVAIYFIDKKEYFTIIVLCMALFINIVSLIVSMVYPQILFRRYQLHNQSSSDEQDVFSDSTSEDESSSN